MPRFNREKGKLGHYLRVREDADSSVEVIAEKSDEDIAEAVGAA